MESCPTQAVLPLVGLATADSPKGCRKPRTQRTANAAYRENHASTSMAFAFNPAPRPPFG
ncbi:MAG: hypothetical protein R6U98_14385 [Pirellulaceae bacterium]